MHLQSQIYALPWVDEDMYTFCAGLQKTQDRQHQEHMSHQKCGRSINCIYNEQSNWGLAMTIRWNGKHGTWNRLWNGSK